MKHVPYDIAIELNSNGFNEECSGYFDKTTKKFYKADKDEYRIAENLPSILCPAPIYQDVIDWFLEKHDIFISPTCRRLNPKEFDCIIDIPEDGVMFSGYKPTVYEAYNTAFEMSLKYIGNEKN